MAGKYPEVSGKMEKTIDVYAQDLKTIRAGRANPAILDKITVDYYGSATPIPQIGNVSGSGTENSSYSALGQEHFKRG